MRYGRARSDGQQQNVAKLAREIAAGMQLDEEPAHVFVDGPRTLPQVALLVDADNRAIRSIARFDIDDGLEFHILETPV